MAGENKSGAGPGLLLAMLAIIVALTAAFFVLRAKPPGAIDSQPSPVQPAHQ